MIQQLYFTKDSYDRENFETFSKNKVWHNSGIPYTPYRIRVRIKIRVRIRVGLGIRVRVRD